MYAHLGLNSEINRHCMILKATTVNFIVHDANHVPCLLLVTAAWQAKRPVSRKMNKESDIIAVFDQSKETILTIEVHEHNLKTDYKQRWNIYFCWSCVD